MFLATTAFVLATSVTLDSAARRGSTVRQSKQLCDFSSFGRVRIHEDTDVPRVDALGKFGSPVIQERTVGVEENEVIEGDEWAARIFRMGPTRTDSDPGHTSLYSM
jgi:hypothetical protein